MSDRYDADAAKLLPCIAGITCDEAPRDPKCWTCSRRSAVAAALRALGEWREAIIDAAVVNWTYKQEHEVNPRAAVNDLLAWQSKIALDPRVSLRAKELHDKIRTLGEENER
ncbi:MAG TPA: hypothetical protein VNG73_07635, partial [Gemmatimonadaceae bacterium]|nr:hypothetical protein [Gemmatimonadaceae bacterium]